MSEYQQLFKGTFTSALRWSELDTLWQTLKQQPDNWYVYFVGQDLPTECLDSDDFILFLDEIDQLLHKDHQYDYCGIVYHDNASQPKMVKIFDPKNLGISCGSSGEVVLPRWILSKIPPDLLKDEAPIPMNRQRWWQNIWHSKKNS